MTVSPRSWIVLSPSREAAVLRGPLVAYLCGKGVRAVDADLSGLADREAQVVVTSDIDVALAAGTDLTDITVVRLSDCISLSHEAPDDGLGAEIFDTSRKLSAALAFGGRRVSDLRDIELVGPDFKADDIIRRHTELPVTRRESALKNALALYERGSADWASPVFFYDDRNADSAQISGEIDATGRSRFLFSGPYIFLPKGKWRAVLRLGFDEGASRARYHADWGEGQVHIAQEFRPERGGVYEITLDRDWNEPGPSELRLALLEGVFHGRIFMLGAHISRIA